MRCKCCFNTMTQRFWKEIPWACLPSRLCFSPSLNFSNVLCAISCVSWEYGGFFGWGSRDTVGLVCLWRKGWRWSAVSSRTLGIWRIPSSSRCSAQLSNSTSCRSSGNYHPFFVAAHETHLHCVNWREDLLLIRVGICSDTNHIILKEFNPWLFTKSWFPRVGKWVNWMGKMNFCLIPYEFVAILCSSLDLGLHLWSSTCFICIKITFFESLLIPALWLEDIAMK